MSSWKEPLNIKIAGMNEQQVRKRIVALEKVLDPTPRQNAEYELLEERLAELCEPYFTENGI